MSSPHGCRARRPAGFVPGPRHRDDRTRRAVRPAGGARRYRTPATAGIGTRRPSRARPRRSRRRSPAVVDGALRPRSRPHPSRPRGTHTDALPARPARRSPPAGSVPGRSAPQPVEGLRPPRSCPARVVWSSHPPDQWHRTKGGRRGRPEACDAFTDDAGSRCRMPAAVPGHPRRGARRRRRPACRRP